MPDNYTIEPDNLSDAELGTLPSKPGYPAHKPTPPDDGRTANSMAHVMDYAAKMANAVKVSDLTTDHPYGDGKHGETGTETLARLGAGKKYGE